jgi:LPXTG-motif cell wall-anchored protein
MAITDAVDAKLDLSNTKAAKRVDRMLDDAVEDSFPASDPVALAMPRARAEKGALRAAAESNNTWFLLAGGLLAVIALIALRR